MFGEISENLLIPRRKIVLSNSANQNLRAPSREGLRMPWLMGSLSSQLRQTWSHRPKNILQGPAKQGTHNLLGLFSLIAPAQPESVVWGWGCKYSEELSPCLACGRARLGSVSCCTLALAGSPGHLLCPCVHSSTWCTWDGGHCYSKWDVA